MAGLLETADIVVLISGARASLMVPHDLLLAFLRQARSKEL